MRRKVEVEQIAAYKGHTGSLFGLTYSDETGMLYSGGDDGVVAGWDLNNQDDTGEGILKLSHGIYALLEIPQYQLLVVGGSEGSVYFLDVQKKEIVKSFNKGGHSVYNLYYDARNFVIWILHEKGYLHLLEIPSFETRFLGKVAENNLRGIAGEKEGETVFMGTSDHKILAFSARNMELKHRWKAHENSVFSLALHPNGAYIVSGGRDAHLNIWQSEAPYNLVESIPAHNFTINAVCFADSGEYFATGSRDKTIKVWDAYTFDLLKVIDYKRNEGHTHSVNRLTWIRRDNSLISCSDDRRILRWKLRLIG